MARLDTMVRGWVDDAAVAARDARLRPRDADALHRFRVASRRILSYAALGRRATGIPRRARRRLRRALRATGPWRDAHVAARWTATGGRVRGAAALARAVARAGEDARAAPGWWRRVGRTLAALSRALEDARPDRGRRRRALDDAARRRRRRLVRRLRRLDASRDARDVHAARVCVKKLRYLLEASGKTAGRLPSVKPLRRLQAALGGVHDRDVIAAAIAATSGGPALAAARREAAARLARERRARLARAEKHWKALLPSPR